MQNQETPSSPIRNQYLNKNKLRYINKFEKTNCSKSEFCRKKNISRTSLTRWLETKPKLVSSPQKSVKNGCGRKPLYEDVQEHLFGLILDMRSDGMVIDHKWIRNEAQKFYKEQEKYQGLLKVPIFSNMWISGFFSRYNLTVRKASSSRIEKNIDHDEIAAYQRKIAYTLKFYDIKESDIYNMDETGIFFDMTPDHTIDVIGARKVSLVKNYASKTRFTCVITIKADGTIYDPMIIFKGRNITPTLKNIVTTSEITVQDNAWMNIDKMKQYIASLPNTLEYKLFLMDAFSVHKNAEIMDLLYEKKFIVVFVPAGYTDLLQPLDVAIMKPFKMFMRGQFISWLQKDGIIDGKVKCPTKDLLCTWVDKSIESITTEQVRNSFETAKIFAEDEIIATDNKIRQ